MRRNPIFILPDPKNSKRYRKKQKNIRNSRQVTFCLKRREGRHVFAALRANGRGNSGSTW